MMINKILNQYNLPTLISILALNILTVTYFPYYVYKNGIVWQEPILFIIGWIFSGMGITVGYHRYFSHRTFKTSPFIEWILLNKISDKTISKRIIKFNINTIIIYIFFELKLLINFFDKFKKINRVIKLNI